MQQMRGQLPGSGETGPETVGVPFSQLDGSITGGIPATCLPKPIRLREGTHVETIRFIAVSRMTEAMVLGVA